MSDLFLGIDTSNYKTSVAVTDSSGTCVFQKSEFLPVPQGSRGLRQSECFFRHSCRLPDYISELCSEIDIHAVKAAGVSSRPRRTEGSYMPCFLAGVNAAREMTSVLGIPLYEFSHQEGHAAAVMEYGTETEDAGQISSRALLMHLSGGTTEILTCQQDRDGYALDIIGGTRDISIGQLIDRAGVAMGYSFPAGSFLDKLAEAYALEYPGSKPGIASVKVREGYFNLSGIETQTLRWIEAASSEEYPFIAYSLFERIAQLLAASAADLSLSETAGTVYMAGGVASSSFIRKAVQNRIKTICKGRNDRPQLVFSSPALSGDNAVGIALLAGRLFHSAGSIL